MILLCGIPSETPLSMVRDELDAIGEPLVMFNQREVARTDIWFDVGLGGVVGELQLGDRRYPLQDFAGVYNRMMDDQLLPELRGEPPASQAREHARTLHETLAAWLEIANTRVVNRARAGGSNFSKPYQAQLIRRAGFQVPETLITNDPALAAEFLASHPRVVYKSMSGNRSIVTLLEASEIERLSSIRWCPVQFQAYVEGTNVRVHTIDKEVFATAILTDAADYRYAGDSAHPREVEPYELLPSIAAQCVELARDLGLAFAGIDLKITPDGNVFCFEVNPCPAFSFYEAHTEQPIAHAVARYLSCDGHG